MAYVDPAWLAAEEDLNWMLRGIRYLYAVTASNPTQQKQLDSLFRRVTDRVRERRWRSSLAIRANDAERKLGSEPSNNRHGARLLVQGATAKAKVRTAADPTTRTKVQ